MDERVVVLGSSANSANVELVAAWRELGIEAELVAPTEAAGRMDAGTVAVARLDVLPSLDGVEPGLLGLLLLERAGIARVLNTARALLAAHDKRRTAPCWRRRGSRTRPPSPYAAARFPLSTRRSW